MPDMLVLSRNRTNGALEMHVEIDTDPVVRPKWEARPLPRPIAYAPRVARDRADVEWLEDEIVDYVDSFDWAPDELEAVDWNGLRADVVTLAFAQ